MTVMSDFELHKLCLEEEVSVWLQLKLIAARLQKTRIYFNAVIKPLMMYASPVRTSCNKEALERVLRMQKGVARIEAQRTSRIVTMFNNLSWIPFYNEVYIK